MSNCHCIITAGKCVPCSQEEFDRLDAILKTAADDNYHGFDTEFDGGGDLYLYADDNGSESDLPRKFLKELGELIAAADMPYLQFGAAMYDDKPRPDSSGGYSFRIMPDGSLTYPAMTWEPDEIHS